MQASAYLPIQLFEEFLLTEDIIFRINLNVLVECLSIFWSSINTQGNAITLEMHYKVIKVLWMKTIYFSVFRNSRNFVLIFRIDKTKLYFIRVEDIQSQFLLRKMVL